MSDAVIVPLTQGAVALVSPEDAARVCARRWHLVHNDRNGNKYAATAGYGVRAYMHRFILTAPKGVLVDHVNGNGLDNRRSNIRLCTNSQNMANARKRLTNAAKSSSYKGVRWHAQAEKWTAKVGGSYIGIFADEIEAALAYDRAARALYGEFARPNFPNGVPSLHSLPKSEAA